MGGFILALGLLGWLPSAAVASASPRGPGVHPLASIGACTTKTGVLVAVDFRFWDQPVERGCAPTPTTGYAALHNAGFTTAGDAHDGDAFVCRIDARPSPNEDGCRSTPFPPDSWSYWHAVAGSSHWTFSQLGVMSYHPPPGSIDAWVFGNTNAPTFTPAEVRAGTTPPPTTTASTTTTTRPVTKTAPPTTGPTTTAPTTTAPTTTTTARIPATVRPTTTTSRPPRTFATGPTTSTTRPKASTTTTGPAGPKRATTRRRADPSPGRRARHSRGRGRAALSPHPTSRTTTTHSGAGTTSPPTTALRIVNVAAGSSPAQPSGSSPIGLLVGLGAVLVVGGAALITARRRRRAAG